MDGSLYNYGEDALIARLVKMLPQGKEVVTGPGDDCAVLPLDERWDALLKADVVVENVHFLPGENPELIGYKALARALSDIAAMGGIPEYAVVTLLADGKQLIEKIEGIYRGLSDCASQYGVSIVGGETSSLPREGLVLNVALTGKVEKNGALLRSTAKAGDLLFVSGVLGESLSGHHLNFQPRLKEGRFLRSRQGVHAMMDLSDGLAKDLPRLARASGLGFDLYKESLPRRNGCKTENALNDGEDYELLVAVDEADAEYLLRKWDLTFPDTPLSLIGKMTNNIPSDDSWNNGGWEHFRKDL